jgi:AGZA family xanthine/uracil permease-like MFS transporter
VVNPGILSDAIFLQKSGDLFNELAIATLVMGLLANYPFALAPGMGLNAFFAYAYSYGERCRLPFAVCYTCCGLLPTEPTH